VNGLRSAVCSVVPLLLSACAGTSPVSPLGASATAEVRDAGNRVVGQATLTEVSGGVRILLEASGLTSGPHGVHLHAVGKCEPPAFASAGDHLNPQNKQHGLLNPSGPHAGDLPNLTIEPDGKGRLETFTDRVTLGPGPTSLFDDDGTALVIHAAPDDFRTDPAGNSGPRIACGTIEKPPAKP
jgi:superoxide dismutase, Cu-Zn family